MTDDDFPQYKNPDWLEQQYWEREKSTVKIAELCGVSDTTIRYWLDKFDIDRRDPPGSDGKHRDEQWLREQYVDKKLSIREIADKTNIHHENVRYWLDKYGIERRDQLQEAGRKAREKLAEGKHLNESWLREKYIHQNKSAPEMADLVGVAPNAILRSMQRFGIERRGPGPQSGEHHPGWEGGRPHYYGENYPRKRRQTLERDGHECRVCGLSRERHREQYGEDIHVHHIKPIRTFENVEDANTLDNMVTLCRPHHHKWEGIPVIPHRD